MSEVSTPLGTLRCTVGAFKAVSNFFGGLLPAYRRVNDWDAGAYTFIAAAALNKTEKDDITKLEQQIFEIGFGEMQAPFLEYLERLGNGGRKPEPKTPADESTDQGNR